MTLARKLLGDLKKAGYQRCKNRTTSNVGSSIKLQQSFPLSLSKNRIWKMM